MNVSIETSYGGRQILCEVTDTGHLELWLQGVLRKRRPVAGQGATYVWTNVELEWEMHHLVEGFYSAETGWLELVIHGQRHARAHAAHGLEEESTA